MPKADKNAAGGVSVRGDIEPGTAIEHVGSSVSKQKIVIGSADERVVSGPASEDVVAGFAAEGVVGVIADDEVVERATGDAFDADEGVALGVALRGGALPKADKNAARRRRIRSSVET